MRSQTYLCPQRLMRQLKPRWRRKTPLSCTWLRQKCSRRSPSATKKNKVISRVASNATRGGCHGLLACSPSCVSARCCWFHCGSSLPIWQVMWHFPRREGQGEPCVRRHVCKVTSADGKRFRAFTRACALRWSLSWRDHYLEIAIRTIVVTLHDQRHKTNKVKASA